jgi:para-aminobenzoate synthetase
MRTLLIDNYDSFTYNLFQLLAEVNGEEPVVVRNDEAGWKAVSRLDFDNVVVSPGPGRPERGRDFGACAELIRRCEAPLLGVCLGHQGLGWVQGGAVVPAEPMHGKVSTVSHDGCSPLFEGIPRRFKAVRYHSLRLAAPPPGELEPIAWAEDGVVMGIAHRGRPHWGVQFHPESVATEHGRRLLENFRDLTPKRRRSPQNLESRSSLPRRGGAFSASIADKSPIAPGSGLELRIRRLGFAIDPEAAFGALYAESETAFWLDSCQPGPQARFSFLGDASGPLAATLSYDVEKGEVTVERDGKLEVGRGPLLHYLDRELRRLRPLIPELPFGFDCGFVGYLGYELKAECGADRAHRSELPDAALVFADRLVAVDHDEGDTHLLCLTRPDEAAEAERWLAATASTLASLDPGRDGCEKRGGGSRAGAPNGTAGPVEPRLARSHARYLGDIGECKARLIEGESYEICLTNSLSAEFGADPLDLYRELRRVNPAPFSAYLRFGDLAVLSSSPERFLKVDRGRRVEARPIKGTSRRGATPEEDALLAARLGGDPKSQAENLMIVDLLRNDLGSVSEVGSVEVTALMEVEAYETVHHLVSAIQARLRAGATATDCVQACFPPGSMTGAPKRRTMEILDRIEGRSRGPYSGAIGYFGLGGGCDLSVAIRTIVVAGGEAAIGAGGAIVAESDPQQEYEEMVLKAEAPMMAIDASRQRSLPAGAGRV